MSQFLSNILTRHSQSENIVHSRGLGIFETRQAWFESKPASHEEASADRNTIPNPSESQTEKTRSNQVNTNKISEDNSLRQENKVIKRDNRQWINKPEKKTENIEKNPLKEMNLNTETSPVKKDEFKNVKRQLKNKMSDKSVMNKTHKIIADLGSNNKVSKPELQWLDKQNDTAVVAEQMLVEPNKELKHQLFANFNTITQSENSIKSYHFNKISSADQSQSIKIHIGRIDIKAVKPPTIKTPEKRKANKPGMSLDQFLKKREGRS